MSSEVPTMAQEASNRSARASLDGVLTRSTASILNATRYCPSLSMSSPLTACFLRHARPSLFLLLLSPKCNIMPGVWTSYCTQLISSASASLEKSNKCGVTVKPLQLSITPGTSSRRKRRSTSGMYKRSDSKQPKQNISTRS